MLKTLYMATKDEYGTVDATNHSIDRSPAHNINDVPNFGDEKDVMAGLISFSHYMFTGNPKPLCQPVFTYMQKGVASKANSTDDLFDETLWSVNTTDTSHLIVRSS